MEWQTLRRNADTVRTSIPNPTASRAISGGQFNRVIEVLEGATYRGRAHKTTRGVIPRIVAARGIAAPFDHPFKVSCSASAVTITNGRHEWFRTTTNEYAETILGNATIGWDELIPPASNNDKLYLWVKREHDSGEVDTATIEVGGATTLETVPMPNYYTAVWIIAVVTNTNGALSVEQRVLEDLQNDGPDIRQSGRIMMWTSTTIPRGWKRYTGYDARFIAGYSGSGDYAAVGNTGGYTWHGQTENNHQDHNAQHQHDVAPDPDTQVEAGTGGYAWSTDVDLVTDGCITWLGGSSLPTYEGPSNDMFTHKGPFNSNADTDNRPPYVVALFIQKV